MNTMKLYSKSSTSSRMRGAGLLEVLVAILIFVVGMLALAHLQTNLTRSSADANTRTIATNIGEELLERLRAYQLVRTDPDGTLFAFADIDGDFVSDTVERGGNTYTVTGAVEGYDFDDDGVSVTETSPAVAGEVYDFKVVELTVSWDSATEFQVDESTQMSSNDAGTGSITIRGVIPSIPVLASAVLAAEEDPAGGPPVVYSPGPQPNIVPLQLDTGKFKESTSPAPEIRHELGETWFDVITYSQAQGQQDGVYLRREEFVAIQCECALLASTGVEAGDGFPPAVWTGAEYKVGEMINKPYGEQDSSGQEQSLYCDTCCRDHHDSASSSIKFRPWMAANQYVNGDHPHYYQDGDTKRLTVPWNGRGNPGPENTYLEACRLVRKDGFFRVAQDFHMYEHNAFPEEYLSTEGDVTEYSDYVRAVAHSELGNGGAPGDAADELSYLGRKPDLDLRSEVTADPAVNADPQQLRSRGIYVDSMNPYLQANLASCFGIGGAVNASACEVPTATTAFELYPFFDIQVTFLALWSETVDEDPVHISDDLIPANFDSLLPDGVTYSYSRGAASLSRSKVGISTGHSAIDNGNVGLIATAPIEDIPPPVLDISDIYLVAGEGTDPGNNDDPLISGTLTANAQTDDEADLTIVGSPGVTCSKTTSTTFGCRVNLGELSGDARITVSNYWRNSATPLIICSVGLTYVAHTNGTSATTNQTIFTIPTVDTSGVILTIKQGSSPADC